jgi:hypothetical protein
MTNEGNGRPMTALEELAAKYGTDKLQHGYLPFYEKHLPKEPKRILEIGVKEGRSLAMWTEYFPDAEVHGLDLFAGITSLQVRERLAAWRDNNDGLSQEKIHLHQGNQCDYKLLEELRKYDFDVIIDDGSHNSRDQLMTFFGLFNGKHYFIEDLHCCAEDFYSQGLPYDFRAFNLFGDIKIANNNNEESFDIDFMKAESRFSANKIVCIRSSEHV